MKLRCHVPQVLAEDERQQIIEAAERIAARATAPGGPTTCAKVPGAQSMMEKTMQTSWAILGGAHSFDSNTIRSSVSLWAASPAAMSAAAISATSGLLLLVSMGGCPRAAVE